MSRIKRVQKNSRNNQRMDINLFRKSLASKQGKLTNINESDKKLEESVIGSNLAHQILSLRSSGDVKKMANTVAEVQIAVQEKADSEKHLVNKYKKLLYNLQELLDMLDAGRIDPSEIEILQSAIVVDLKRLV